MKQLLDILSWLISLLGVIFDALNFDKGSKAVEDVTGAIKRL
jgi:hypothetical protein